jgi:proline dehydrogenase
VDQAKAFAGSENIQRNTFEFQMLHGIRRDLQQGLVKDGWRMRVYIPFGTEWYPYLMRRLAERPANIVFIFGNVVRETLSRKLDLFDDPILSAQLTLPPWAATANARPARCFG